jgi:hypothetical protein
MWKYLKKEEFYLSEEDKEKLELVNWAFNSHFWVETSHGYATCKYCGDIWTDQMGISVDTIPRLCKKNPIIRDFVMSLIL